MSQEVSKRINDAIMARLAAFGVTECEVLGVSELPKGGEARLKVVPNRQANVNALVLQIIAAINTANESDIDCMLSSCNLVPPNDSKEITLIAAFTVASHT